MRILHTSDWHLGQAFHSYDRSEEHQAFLDWLLDTLTAEKIDALLIAGDIFDNANPSAASLRQFYRFLQQARARLPQLDIVVIAGNHDSPGRLEAPAPLLEAHGATIIGFVPRRPDGSVDAEAMVLPIHRADGSVGAWCMAVPFLRPGDVPRVEDARDPYLDGIAALYRDVFNAAQARGAQPVVAMGHCHMVEGKASVDSERRIVIGGSEALPASVFDERIAYAALGHLHLAQRVGQKEHVRYSGSPLPLSFSEIDYKHQVLRIDLDGTAVVTPIPIPRTVPLLRVPSQPAPAEEMLAALAALELPETDIALRPYLQARLLEDRPEPGIRARVDAALAGKPVRLCWIERTTRSAPGAETPALSLEQLQQLQPEEIFRRLYQQKYGEDAPADLQAAFGTLLLDADA